MTDLSEISTTDLIKELMNRLAKDQYHLHDIMNRNTSLMNNKWNTVSGQILTSAKVTDINTFDQPKKVQLARFTGAKKQGDQLVIDMPPQSVIMLELK